MFLFYFFTYDHCFVIQSAAERRARHRACPDQSKSVSKIVKKVNKIGPKSRSKNAPKSSPKWSQMHPCWLQKRGLEGSPIGFWGSFSKFLRLLAVLVALGGCWGPFCTALGRKRWPTWLQVGFQNRANIDEKSVEKSIQNLMHLGIDFFWILGRKMEPSWHQNRIRNAVSCKYEKCHLELAR